MHQIDQRLTETISNRYHEAQMRILNGVDDVVRLSCGN